MRHLKKIVKVRKLNKWVYHELTTDKKNHFEVWSSLILCINSEPFLHQIVTCDKKWILYDNWWWPAPQLDWEEAPKHFPRPNFHPKKVTVSIWWSFGGLLTVWFSTSFWIVVKPLYLRSMLSKSITIENFNAFSWHWLTGPSFWASCTTSASKVELIGLRGFASSSILTWPFANQPFLQATFCRENASTTSKRQNMLSKNWLNNNTGVVCQSLFQGILATQGWNPGCLHWRWIL